MQVIKFLLILEYIFEIYWLGRRMPVMIKIPTTGSQRHHFILIKSKKQAEAEAKKNKQQRDQYATTVKSYDAFQKKNDREKLDNINKQIASPPDTSMM